MKNCQNSQSRVFDNIGVKWKGILHSFIFLGWPTSYPYTSFVVWKVYEQISFDNNWEISFDRTQLPCMPIHFSYVSSQGTLTDPLLSLLWSFWLLIVDCCFLFPNPFGMPWDVYRYGVADRHNVLSLTVTLFFEHVFTASTRLIPGGGSSLHRRRVPRRWKFS